MLLVVGAGISGAVMARVLAEHGFHVLVVDERTHVAGNCHTVRDLETGVLEHIYGPHIFHTDDLEVWAFVNRFAEFQPYRHTVYATVGRDVYALPINLHTINQHFRTNFSPASAEAFLKQRRGRPVGEDASFEERALATVGEELYETFYLGYTLKQWGRHPRDLPGSIFARLPVRFNYDSNYFFHRHQGIPTQGYTAMVEKILDHDLIEVQVGRHVTRSEIGDFQQTFWTGPIDAFFDYEEGNLEYRSLRFEREVVDGDYQGCPVMNFPSQEIPYTRITEHKHFAPWENHDRTVIYREYSEEHTTGKIPYYPVRLKDDKATFGRYLNRAVVQTRTSFIGRLGTYRYLDMDVAVKEALLAARLTVQSLVSSSSVPTFFSSVS